MPGAFFFLFSSFLPQPYFCAILLTKALVAVKVLSSYEYEKQESKVTEDGRGYYIFK